jgi:hypothetical protein
MRPGDIVWIRAFDEVPGHRFRIHEVHADHVTGMAITGPLAGCYGEPERVMIETTTPEEPYEPGTPEQPKATEEPEVPEEPAQGTPITL